MGTWGISKCPWVLTQEDNMVHVYTIPQLLTPYHAYSVDCMQATKIIHLTARLHMYSQLLNIDIRQLKFLFGKATCTYRS